VNRNEELFREAMELTRRGVTVDLDVVDEDLVHWLRLYDGDRSMLTISTDSPIGKVSALLGQVVEATNVFSIEEAFALATRNPARVLKLHDVGEIAEGKRADLLLLDAKTLQLRSTWTAGALAR
jgi:imidazolonepropionase-like amidohydrolase